MSGIHYDASDFSLRVGDDGWVLNLDNVFRKTADLSSDARAAGIVKFAATFLASTENTDAGWDQVRTQLRPVLRWSTRHRDLTSPHQTLARPALPFLDEFVVIDHPDRREFVPASQPADWGVSAEEVFAQARQNMSGEPPEDLNPNAVLNFVDNGGDAYFSSRLLTPEWLAAFATEERRPVFFVPDHDTLILAPDEPQVVGAMFELVEQQFRDADDPLSVQGYTLDDHGNVVPLDQIAQHPNYAAARRARCGMTVEVYGAQHAWLQDKLEANIGFDDELQPAYLAAPLFSDDERGAFTATTWGEGVEYLLPEVDYVVFCDTDEHGEMRSLFTVPFREAVEITGVTPVPDLAPPRYEARQWPDSRMMAALRLAAVSL
jgi:hypothetical protein